MKKLYAYLVCLLFVAASGVASDLEEASVTMGYSEFASLLDRVSAMEASLEHANPEPLGKAAFLGSQIYVFAGVCQ